MRDRQHQNLRVAVSVVLDGGNNGARTILDAVLTYFKKLAVPEIAVAEALLRVQVAPRSTISRGPSGASALEALALCALDSTLAHGFAGTSIDRIAAAAGVLRQTIYNNFDGKEELFRALVGMLADHVLEPLRGDDPAADNVEATLTDLAERALSVAVPPSTLALHRLVVTEAPKFPDVARQAYEGGAKRAVEALAAYLARQRGRGALAVDDPELAAEHFFGMLAGHRQYRALLGVEEPGRQSDDDRAAATVRAFLRAYAP